VDTSVLGGCLDRGFSAASQRIIDACSRGELTIVFSELTIRELEAAPEGVRKIAAGVPDACVEFVSLSPEVEELATAYVDSGAIGARMRVDALHIAAASVARVDVLVSWNFKHIVNLRRIHAYNAVNLKNGYPLLEIRSPLEVLDDE
jgi:predicted nucleic acid-binding protein